MSGFNAELDDVAWQAALRAADARARNMTPAMKWVRERLEQRVRDTFRLRRDPWGNAWQPWKNREQLLKARRRAGIKGKAILFASGALFDSIKGAHDATSVTIEQGAEGPSAAYADVHQFGLRAGSGAGFTMPRRASMPINASNKAELPAKWYDEVALKLHSHIAEAFL